MTGMQALQGVLSVRRERDTILQQLAGYGQLNRLYTDY